MDGAVASPKIPLVTSLDVTLSWSQGAVTPMTKREVEKTKIRTMGGAVASPKIPLVTSLDVTLSWSHGAATPTTKSEAEKTKMKTMVASVMIQTFLWWRHTTDQDATLRWSLGAVTPTTKNEVENTEMRAMDGLCTDAPQNSTGDKTKMKTSEGSVTSPTSLWWRHLTDQHATLSWSQEAVTPTTKNEVENTEMRAMDGLCTDAPQNSTGDKTKMKTSEGSVTSPTSLWWRHLTDQDATLSWSQEAVTPTTKNEVENTEMRAMDGLCTDAPQNSTGDKTKMKTSEGSVTSPTSLWWRHLTDQHATLSWSQEAVTPTTKNEVENTEMRAMDGLCTDAPQNSTGDKTKMKTSEGSVTSPTSLWWRHLTDQHATLSWSQEAVTPTTKNEVENTKMKTTGSTYFSLFWRSGRRPEAGSTACRRRPEAGSTACRRRPEAGSTACRRRPEAGSTACRRRPEAGSTACRRRPEAGSTACRRRPEAGSTACRRRPEAGSTACRRRPEAGSTACRLSLWTRGLGTTTSAWRWVERANRPLSIIHTILKVCDDQSTWAMHSAEWCRPIKWSGP